MTKSEILEALNSYKGGNIWQDVIYDMITGEEWDVELDSADEFEHDGITYRHEAGLGKWVAR